MEANRNSKSLVDGFMRENSNNLKILIPLELFVIIWFYQMSFEEFAYDQLNDNFDKWDETSKHEAYMVQGDNAERVERGSNPYIFGCKRINNGIAIWKLKCINYEFWALIYWVGIVDITRNDTDKMTNLQRNKGNHLIYAPHGSLYPKNDRCQNKQWHKLHQKNFKFGKDKRRGDVICIMLNLHNKTLSFSLNGGDFVCAFENMDDNTEYVLAVSMSIKAGLEMMASKYIQ